MMKRLLIVSVFFCGSLQAMVFDNRFLPLYFKPHTRRCDAFSWIRIQPFFMRADRAFSSEERHANIPDLEGPYDQVLLARALEAAGHENPLRSDFRLKTTLPWFRRGRLEAQGLALYYEQAFGPYVSVGIGTFYGRVNARHEFLLKGNELALPEGDKEYLFQAKELMHKELGIVAPFFRKVGFGDTDLYVRFGSMWDYTLKCRRLDPAFKLGLIIPTASTKPFDNPAAISLGGQGHWGIYGAFEFESECKEDLIVGLNFRAIKRFKKTCPMHLPILGEPAPYGAVVGPVTVTPGWTFVANPYISFEGLREGFGLKAQYTVVAHLRDAFNDKRALDEQKKHPVLLNTLECRSSWGMEHVTIGAFYDFGKVRECPTLYPKLSAYWDIPVEWLVSKRAAKTSSVSLMLEFDF